MINGKLKNYEDLLELINKYQYGVIAEFFNGFPTVFVELYTNAKEDVKAVYLKNFYNKKDGKEVIFFFVDKIVSVTKSSDNLCFNFVEYKGKIIKKEFLIHRRQEMYRHTKLTLSFDSGDTIFLDNELDTNIELAEEYGWDIKEISKMF